VGIDENTALLVRDNRSAKVVGETHVMFVDGRSRKGAFLVHILKSGDVFDLKRRKPVAGAGS